jgi:hypothetical protein
MMRVMRFLLELKDYVLLVFKLVLLLGGKSA